MSEIGDLFESLVLRCFDFLIREHGFRCTEKSDFIIRFESEKVCIDICHSPRDREIYVDFQRRSDSESIGFTLFLRRYFPEALEELGDIFARTPEKVVKVVQALSNALRTYGEKIINGDDEFYNEMAKVRWWHFFPEALQ